MRGRDMNEKTMVADTLANKINCGIFYSHRAYSH